jgi:hypothetical protein
MLCTMPDVLEFQRLGGDIGPSACRNDRRRAFKGFHRGLTAPMLVACIISIRVPVEDGASLDDQNPGVRLRPDLLDRLGHLPTPRRRLAFGRPQRLSAVDL